MSVRRDFVRNAFSNSAGENVVYRLIYCQRTTAAVSYLQWYLDKFPYFCMTRRHVSGMITPVIYDADHEIINVILTL